MKFRLQQVLELRRRREEEMRQRLGAATRARVEAEAALRRRIANEHAHRADVARMLLGGRVDAGAVQDMGMILEADARAIAAQQAEVGRRAAFEAEERGRLTAAMADRKALDRLRERHVERERIESNRKEAVLLDEIATARAVRDRPLPPAPRPLRISATRGGGATAPR